MDFMISTVFMVLQIICTILALIFNSFLIFVVLRYTRSKIGFYKYMLIFFAIFEMVFAVIVLVGMPINFIADNSWVVFNHDGLIGNTSFNWLGPTLYCTFYELWIGLVVVHFVYRYLAVCRSNWKDYISEHHYMKAIILLIYFCHVVYSFFCGLIFCTREVMTKELRATIQKEFSIENADNMGYTLIRTYVGYSTIQIRIHFQTEDGRLSLLGTASLLNHYVLVTISFGIINICGYKVWKQIGVLQKQITHIKEINLQKQMFYTLVIQTVIPLFLCHTPSVIYLTFPFWSKSFTFGGIASVFSFLTSVPKVLDPIVALCCIREYRRATKSILFSESESMANQHFRCRQRTYWNPYYQFRKYPEVNDPKDI